MRSSRILLVLSGCALLAGCSLVPVPGLKTTSHVVSDIRVVAHDTQRPLSSAVVAMESRRGRLLEANETPTSIIISDPAPDPPFGTPVIVEKYVGGHWTPLRAITPRPGQQVRITARAPGYRHLQLHFHPSACQTPAAFRDHLQKSPHAEYCEISNSGVLTLHLPLDDARP